MNDVSVLFSGGPDSTLAVLKALEHGERVHLLTYHHSFMSRMGRHRIVTEELRERFGTERIVSHEEEIGTLYRRLYRIDWKTHVPRYRTFYIPWMCGACKLAMHCRTIAYNREHGIRTTFDGANKESSTLFPAQTPEYITVMREWYQRHGMTYDVPVYEEDQTDVQCERHGMTSMRNTKKEHVHFSTQHSCYVGLIIHAHARLYYRPFRGRQRMRRNAAPFLDGIINRIADQPEAYDV
jgi:7-cyano-7-deazaguanine synthase in queuosine biosynthesis